LGIHTAHPWCMGAHRPMDMFTMVAHMQWSMQPACAMPCVYTRATANHIRTNMQPKHKVHHEQWLCIHVLLGIPGSPSHYLGVLM
jgi:hypothetical protein